MPFADGLRSLGEVRLCAAQLTDDAPHSPESEWPTFRGWLRLPSAFEPTSVACLDRANRQLWRSQEREIDVAFHRECSDP